MMKTNPSSFICMHILIDVGMGMCKELMLAESGTSSKNQK